MGVEDASICALLADHPPALPTLQWPQNTTNASLAWQHEREKGSGWGVPRSERNRSIISPDLGNDLFGLGSAPTERSCLIGVQNK